MRLRLFTVFFHSFAGEQIRVNSVWLLFFCFFFDFDTVHVSILGGDADVLISFATQ